MPSRRPAARSDEAEGYWPTVAQVLSWTELRLALRTGEERLDRRVRAVLSTEMVDNTAFLRGGELLLTTGMVWRSGEEGAAFVRAASRAGVSAIGFGTGPWSEVVPESLMTAARRSSMPVLEVPRATPFMAIAERVGTEQAGRRAAHTEEVMLGALMDHVRRGQADSAVLVEHAEFLTAGNRRLAVACHAAVDGAPAPSRELTLVGWREGRVLVVGDEVAVRDHVESRDIAVYGWGGPAAVGSLRRILGEAWSAFEVARQRGGPAAAPDLASVGGLLARLTPEQLSPFADHVLAPIQRYDAIHGTELMATVLVFVRARGSLAGASRVLYLHVNTVRQRMGRVGALVGIDPLDPEGYLVLRLATHAAGGDVEHT